MATLANFPPPTNPAIEAVPASSLTSPLPTTTQVISTPSATFQYSPSTNLPLPKVFTYPSTTPPRLITQGAEALLFHSTYLLPTLPCALKYRPSKPYRHPILDARLTKHRILSEARVLAKCRREGVCVPAVYALDEREGWLMMEWVEGEVVRVRINEFLGTSARDSVEMGNREGLLDLMCRIGKALGKMHSIGVVHGDLTTSNIMLRPHAQSHIIGETDGACEKGPLDGDVVLIDFGLASQSSQDEDRAVDLYVLERAFGSTHPRAEDAFREILVAYGESYKGGKVVLKKLEDVRVRGRKRSMLG